MKGNRYKRTTHMAKWGILDESHVHFFRNRTKHWAKKYLARRERKNGRGENNVDFESR